MTHHDPSSSSFPAKMTPRPKGKRLKKKFNGQKGKAPIEKKKKRKKEKKSPV